MTMKSGQTGLANLILCHPPCHGARPTHGESRSGLGPCIIWGNLETSKHLRATASRAGRRKHAPVLGGWKTLACGCCFLLPNLNGLLLFLLWGVQGPPASTRACQLPDEEMLRFVVVAVVVCRGLVALLSHLSQQSQPTQCGVPWLL